MPPVPIYRLYEVIPSPTSFVGQMSVSFFVQLTELTPSLKEAQRCLFDYQNVFSAMTAELSFPSTYSKPHNGGARNVPVDSTAYSRYVYFGQFIDFYRRSLVDEDVLRNILTVMFPQAGSHTMANVVKKIRKIKSVGDEEFEERRDDIYETLSTAHR